jgi:hypothetical protein
MLPAAQEDPLPVATRAGMRGIDVNSNRTRQGCVGAAVFWQCC